jgi:hypothetical protein
VQGEAGLCLQLADQQMGERAIVDVRAGDHPRRGHVLIVVTPLHDERHPIGDLAVILAVFHALIAMVGRHGLVSRTQEGDIFLAPDEAHMRARLEEGARIGNGALGHEV